MLKKFKELFSRPSPQVMRHVSVPDALRINLSTATVQDGQVDIDRVGTKTKLYRALAVGCIIADTPFIAFNVIAMSGGIRYFFNELGAQDEALDVFIVIVASFFSVIRAIGDMAIANPIEFAEEYASMVPDEKTQEISETKDICKKLSLGILTGFNQIISNITYLIGASANALPVFYVSRPVGWILSIPIVGLGIFYFNLITFKRVNHHAMEFINKFLSWDQSMLIDALKSPLFTFEIFIQTISSAINRGVTFGYIMDQILWLVFDQNEDNPANLYFIYVIFSLTFYATISSRTLNVYESLFNPKFNQISADILRDIHIPSRQKALDFLMASLRGIPIGALLLKYSSKNPTVNITVGGLVGLSFFLHSLYVRTATRLYQIACYQQEKLLPETLSSTDVQPDSERFFTILENQSKTEKLINLATSTNVAGRIASSLAFLGFLVSLNKTLSEHGVLELDFIDLLYLHQLWGNTTFENEASFYQHHIVENFAYYKTKIYIEKQSPRYGYWGSFWKAKKQYPQEYLEHLCASPKPPS